MYDSGYRTCHEAKNLLCIERLTYLWWPFCIGYMRYCGTVQEEVRHVAREFCRVELALKRGYNPVSHAWDGFVKFALEHDAVSEVGHWSELSALR